MEQSNNNKTKMNSFKWISLMMLFSFVFGILVPSLATAQVNSGGVTLPSVNFGFKNVDNPNEVVNAIKIILIFFSEKSLLTLSAKSSSDAPGNKQSINK